VPLRLPAALAFTIVGAAAGAAAGGCGDEKPGLDASTKCEVLCIPAGSGSGGNCPPPTCATGSNRDVCPAGCEPEPIA
jgi:hypothetical protein